MTPRQLAAYFHLARRRQRIEQIEMMHLMLAAFQGSKKDIKDTVKLLLEDSE